MRMTTVAIFDTATKTYSRPVFTQSEAAAIRSFRDEVNRVAADNDLNKHPEDFHLFLIGTFDDQTGAFDQPPAPTLLIQALQVKE